ncbi:MAG: RNA 2',3'-cyclic phosphodiesterase [Nitrospirae bacterium]|nr:RNA 2',3'-cyclic phosphodiesterase [Nitrospirota bacterium]
MAYHEAGHALAAEFRCIPERRGGGMRCFIAIDFPDPLKENFSEIQDELKKTGPEVKWVNPHQIHLTLCFFKSLRTEDIKLISQKVKQEVLNYGPFELVLKGMGSFPPSRDPRVIWIGIVESLKLTALYRMIQKIGQPFGEEYPETGREEPYVPHVTLGRVQSRKNIHLLKQRIKESAHDPVGTCQVNELIFFESRLNQGGPDYFQRNRFSL